MGKDKLEGLEGDDYFIGDYIFIEVDYDVEGVFDFFEDVVYDDKFFGDIEFDIFVD